MKKYRFSLQILPFILCYGLMVDRDPSLILNSEHYYHHRTLMNRVPIYRRIEEVPVVEPQTIGRRFRRGAKTIFNYSVPVGLIGTLLGLLSYAESMPRPQNFFSLSSSCDEGGIQKIKVRNSGWNSGDGVTVRVNNYALYYSEDNPVPEKSVFVIDHPITDEQVQVQLTTGQSMNVFGNWIEGGIIKEATFPIGCKNIDQS